MDILFKNAKILVRDDDAYNVLNSAYLGVSEDRIDYIGFDEPKRKYKTVRDMRGKLLMPGLVNAHTHAAMVLLRGAGSGLPLERWLKEAIFPIEERLTPEDIYAGVTWACAEMIAGGTTCAADMYDYPFSAALAYARSGIKANLCRVGLCFDPELEPAEWERTAECINFINVLEGKASVNPEAIRELPEIAEKMQLPEDIKKAAEDGRLIGDFSFHSEYLTTEKFVKAIGEANSVMHKGVHIHVSETESEHKECMERRETTPVQYFNKLGILDNRAYLAHCVWCTDRDLRIMAEKGASLVHNPSSNLKLGSGMARIPEALIAGVNVALGTDGAASNNNLNMFEEMHLASLIHKGNYHNPTLVTDTQVIDMATINGARALGREDTGALKVGNKADIIALDLTKPHLLPATDIVSLIVSSAQASDVCMTMVDGRILYEDGAYKTIDFQKAKRDLAASFDRIFTRN